MFQEVEGVRGNGGRIKPRRAVLSLSHCSGEPPCLGWRGGRAVGGVGSGGVRWGWVRWGGLFFCNAVPTGLRPCVWRGALGRRPPM